MAAVSVAVVGRSWVVGEPLRLPSTKPPFSGLSQILNDPTGGVECGSWEASLCAVAGGPDDEATQDGGDS